MKIKYTTVLLDRQIKDLDKNKDQKGIPVAVQIRKAIDDYLKKYGPNHK